MTLGPEFFKADYWLPILLWSTAVTSPWVILQQFLESDTFLPRPALQWGEATVVEVISAEQVGQVMYQGSWWRAISQDDTVLLPSTPVLVTGRIGLTLIVKAAFADYSY
ncbi:MAG: hypothetical protein HC929_06215 [Leptolyngbyaceae cyanobacterium SM2_5_2]|nr:hypothetical protein [Leptolyngbyaceae cyanobacterium SM2_5_2]